MLTASNTEALLLGLITLNKLEAVSEILESRTRSYRMQLLDPIQDITEQGFEVLTVKKSHRLFLW
jgi:hypothetical protein